MSRAPRVNGASRETVRAPGTPYGTNAASTALTRLRATQGDTTVNVNPTPSGPPRLTVHNFASFNARVKKLPPDANTAAALTTQLYQFPERVCFACAKCRRDNVRSDSVAIDLRNRIILCTACFTRIIRPRTYRPTRVVPFPSLLSWLNYKPAKATEVAEDVMSRPAEAVAPSGQRVATAMLGSGDRARDLSQLPAIAMNLVAAPQQQQQQGNASLNRARGQATVTAVADRHPCLRIWGSCAHGETCLFRNAPYDLCLAYLMGLCHNGERDGAATKKGANKATRQSCHLLHQEIYDLPQRTDPAPTVRYVGDLEDTLTSTYTDSNNTNSNKEVVEGGVGDVEGTSVSGQSEWARWLQRRRRSPNMAEWQLWHNGPLLALFNEYVPAVPRPVPAVVVEQGSVGDNREGDEASQPVKLNLSDIMSALHQIKKDH